MLMCKSLGTFRTGQIIFHILHLFFYVSFFMRRGKMWIKLFYCCKFFGTRSAMKRLYFFMIFHMFLWRCYFQRLRHRNWTTIYSAFFIYFNNDLLYNSFKKEVSQFKRISKPQQNKIPSIKAFKWATVTIYDSNSPRNTNDKLENLLKRNILSNLRLFSWNWCHLRQIYTTPHLKAFGGV